MILGDTEPGTGMEEPRAEEEPRVRGELAQLRLPRETLQEGSPGEGRAGPHRGAVRHDPEGGNTPGK